MINDKKGMSAVIIMVIMIGLALVVIAIAWVVIQGIVSEGTNTSAIKAKCLNTALEFTQVREGTEHLEDAPSYDVFIMRKGTNSDDAGVKLTFTSTSGVISSPENSEIILKPLLETTQFFGILPGTIPTASKVESVQATPYFVVEDTEEKIYCEDQQISKKISA